MQRSLDLTIAASDNPGGVFFFVTPSLSLSEDLMPSGVLEVRRDSGATGLFGRVEVAWEAAYTDGGTHPVPVDTILANSRGRLVFAAGQTVPENELTLQLNPNSVCELNPIHIIIILLLSVSMEHEYRLLANRKYIICLLSSYCFWYRPLQFNILFLGLTLPLNRVGRSACK